MGFFNQTEIEKVQFSHVFGAMKRIEFLSDALHLMTGGLSKHMIDPDHHSALSIVISGIRAEAEDAQRLLDDLVKLHAPDQVIPRYNPNVKAAGLSEVT